MSAPGIVVVGGGMAGVQLAASLRICGYNDRITIVGEEPDLPYQRPPLSKAYLKGEVDRTGLELRTQTFFDKNRIDLISGVTGTAIERAARMLHMSTGRSLAYQHLVLATGTRNRLLQGPGSTLQGVYYLRTLAEASTLKAQMQGAVNVVVIGAGFIGLEFASVGRGMGQSVTVIEAAPRAMARAVSPATSAFLTNTLMRQGVDFLFNDGVAKLCGDSGRVQAVETSDGRRIAADLVLVCIGVLPNVELAAEAGLAVADGIVVDALLATTDPAISAIGDCASYPHAFAARQLRLESVQNAVDQARSLAVRLTGQPAPYKSVPWFWSDQGTNRLQIAGLSLGAEAAVVRGSLESGSFSVLLYRQEKLIAVESVNRPNDHMQARALLANANSLSPAVTMDESVPLSAYLS